MFLKSVPDDTDNRFGSVTSSNRLVILHPAKSTLPNLSARLDLTMFFSGREKRILLSRYGFRSGFREDAWTTWRLVVKSSSAAL